MFKKILCIGIAALSLSSSIVFATNFIGNSNSRKFHYETCSAAKKMHIRNKVIFHTKKEAINAGYEPCGICKP